MMRDTYSAEKQRIEREIQKLQKQAKALQTKRRAPVIGSIIRTMREYDISPDEIVEAFHKKATRAATPKATDPGKKRVVPPKYRHPDTGETWTGRGKPPRWITAAEAEGKQRDTFLID